jgi:hypothetical protein
MFYQLLYADEFRGEDATGVVGVMKDGDFGIMKEAGAAYWFNNTYINSDLDKKLYNKGVAAIGHNRAKTVGKNIDANAHPFVVDNTFAMVHNGTLRNHHAIGKHEVDSESLAHLFKEAMDQDDYKTAMEAALGKVVGAFACVWYDQKRDEVCMIRNSERPLGWVETKHEIVFGSEIALLNWIVTRNGSVVDKFKSLEVHKLYQFNMKEGNGAVKETFLFPKYPTTTHTPGFKNGVVHLPHKPAPVVTPVTNIPTGTSSTGDKEATSTLFRIEDMTELSKNGFKKLRANIFRKDIEFLQEDYVDAAGKQFLVMGRSINGAYDLCEVRHQISGVLDGDKTGTKEEDFWCDGMILGGTVAECEYDKVAKCAVITVENLKVVRYDIHATVH